MPNKMERFSKRAHQVMTLSEQQAQKLHHPSIEPYHMLLAMLQADNSAAQATLHQTGKLAYADVLATVESLEPGDPAASQQRDLSTATKHLLERSVSQARQRGDHYIGSEHLLFALMEQPDDVTLRVLAENELNPETISQQLERVLLEHSEQPESVPSTSFAALGHERMKVLQMVDDGKITAAEGTELLRSLQITVTGVPFTPGQGLMPRVRAVEENLLQRDIRLVIKARESGAIKYEGRMSVNQALTEIQLLLQKLYSGATGSLVRWEQGGDAIEIIVEDGDES